MLRILCLKMTAGAGLAVLFAIMLASASGVMVAGPLVLSPVADESPYDGQRYAEPDDGLDGSAQRQPDDGSSSEDGTDGEPGATAPDAPSGCSFRDGPLELVV